MIRKVGGNPDMRRRLENLGFVAGGTVTVISRLGDNLVVSVKDCRVAVSREAAQKILVG